MVQRDFPVLDLARINACLPRPATDMFVLTLAAHQVDIERCITTLQTLRFSGARWAMVFDKQSTARLYR